MAKDATRNVFMDLIIANENIIRKIVAIYSNNKTDAEDLQQEIIFQLWKSFSSFRREAKFQTWMYKVALNTALYFRRKQKMKFFALDENFDTQNFQEPLPEGNPRLQMLLNEIKKLDNIERSIILLYLEKHSYKEISQIVGITEKNVSVKLVRIRKKLKERLSHGRK